MADFTGFANAFNEGEISPDAWDRIDTQPVGKGVEAGINCVVMSLGPLAKRRGFFRVSSVADPTKLARMVPFRRSLIDALMLEFGDETARVWQLNGAPLMSGMSQVSFATPYTQAQLATLRYRQVADVIYFRTSAGDPPQALTRNSDTDWSFAVESFPNGPWLTENSDFSSTITVSGTDEASSNLGGNVGSILVGTDVTLLASNPVFDPAQVGGCFRTRAGSGTLSGHSWSPGIDYPADKYVLSAGHVYKCVSTAGNKAASNPPVQLYGSPDQNDGSNTWTYRHDGAGVIQITAVTDATHAAGVVLSTHPMLSGVATSYWSEGAYSDYRGWPRAWPGLREERLVSGATAGNLDIIDLTETAGFDTGKETYHPGTGVGVVISTDAIRERLGDTNGEVIWCAVANYLICGAADAEYLVAGSVLDEPLDPAQGGGITVKRLSQFGTDDVAPALLWNGLCFVQRGGTTLRWLSIDTQQGFTKDDYSIWATHIAGRGLAQLAWLPAPDGQLWMRLADGGLACMTYHQEQQVRGWTRAALGVSAQQPGGWTLEDIVTLPGPGRLETLWIIVSRTKSAVVQRTIWQLSQPADGLFVDGALSYAGAPQTVFSGLDDYKGETVRVLADGAQLDGLVVDGAGDLTLPAAASNVYVGLAYQVVVKSLQLSLGMGGGSLHARERIPGAVLSMLVANAQVGIAAASPLADDTDDNEALTFGGPPELVTTRLSSDLATQGARRRVREVTLSGDGDQDGRDPRVLIVEDSAYPFKLYSIKPMAAIGG